MREPYTAHPAFAIDTTDYGEEPPPVETFNLITGDSDNLITGDSDNLVWV